MDAWQQSTHSQASESLPHTPNEMSTVYNGALLSTSIEQHNALMFNEMRWIQGMSFEMKKKIKKHSAQQIGKLHPHSQLTEGASSRTLKQAGNSSACFQGRDFFVNISCAKYSAVPLTSSDLLSMWSQKMAQLFSVSLFNNLKYCYSTGTMESLNWSGNYDMYAQVAHLITAKFSSTASVRAVHFENTSTNVDQT